MDCPVFTRHRDGRITVDRWTERIVVADEILKAQPDGLKFECDQLTIDVANGRAVYSYHQRTPEDRHEFTLVTGVVSMEMA